jgi:hypothetical protein
MGHEFQTDRSPTTKHLLSHPCRTTVSAIRQLLESRCKQFSTAISEAIEPVALFKFDIRSTKSDLSAVASWAKAETNSNGETRESKRREPEVCAAGVFNLKEAVDPGKQNT